MGIANRVVLKNKKPGRLTPPPSPPFFLSSRSPPPKKKFSLQNSSRTAVAPLERLKILMQVQGNEKVYTGVWQGLARMVKAEGVAGCFKVRRRVFPFLLFPRVFWFFFFPSLCFLSLPSHFHSRELNNHHQNRETGQTASGSSPTPRLSSSSTSSSPARSVTL